MESADAEQVKSNVPPLVALMLKLREEIVTPSSLREVKEEIFQMLSPVWTMGQVVVVVVGAALVRDAAVRRAKRVFGEYIMGVRWVEVMGGFWGVWWCQCGIFEIISSFVIEY